MTASERWRPSEHAIDRWVERVQPGASREQAAVEIVSRACTFPVGGRAKCGGTLLVGEGPDGQPIALVAKYGDVARHARRAGRGSERRHIIATVLGPQELDPVAKAVGEPEAPSVLARRSPRSRPYRRAALAGLRAIALGQGEEAVVSAILREAPDLLHALQELQT